MKRKLVSLLGRPIPIWLLLVCLIVGLATAFTIPQPESNSELTDEQKATAITNSFNERTDGESTLTGITEVERLYLVYWKVGNTTGRSLLIGREWIDFSQ